MMKLGLFQCQNPACREKYDGAIEDEAEAPFLACPTCGQRNQVHAASPSITGRCSNCDKPMEGAGHQWIGDRFVNCSNGKR